MLTSRAVFGVMGCEGLRAAAKFFNLLEKLRGGGGGCTRRASLALKVLALAT